MTDIMDFIQDDPVLNNEYKNLNADTILAEVKKLFPDENGGRQVRMFTGTGGFDMFSEEVEFIGTGKRRLYIGKKVLRILRRLKGEIRQSASGRYFKLVTPIT